MFLRSRSIQAGLRRAGRFAQLRRDPSRRGLTLVELAIVILVLGIIMVIVFTNLDFSVLNKAKLLQFQTAAKTLPLKYEVWKLSNPPLEEGTSLEIFTQRNPNDPTWSPVDKKLVTDPWGNPFYICNSPDGQPGQICSHGPEGTGGVGFLLTDETTWPAELKSGGAPAQDGN